MDNNNQYYYKLMASYLSKRNCDESFMRYLFGKNAPKKSAEELERADERKRRLQRERSRRYRALKNARRQHEGSRDSDDVRRAARSLDDDGSDTDEPPTLCELRYADAAGDANEDSAAPSLTELKAALAAGALRELLAAPDAALDYRAVHSLMFHWLQT